MTLPELLWRDEATKDTELFQTAADPNNAVNVGAHSRAAPRRSRSILIHSVVLTASGCASLKDALTNVISDGDDQSFIDGTLGVTLSRIPNYEAELKTEIRFTAKMFNTFVHFLYFYEIEPAVGSQVADPQVKDVARLVLVAVQLRFDSLRSKCKGKVLAVIIIILFSLLLLNCFGM